MKIKYLGTAAYEGVPSLYCDCKVCRDALRKGGRNLRTRSQALINDDLLIDFNADTLVHYQTYRFSWDRIKTCLITHSHSDHFYPEDIVMNNRVYAKPSPSFHIDFYGGESIAQKIKEMNQPLKEDGSLHETLCFHLVKHAETFETNGYRVTPLNARHDPASTPFVYIIEKEGKAILYNHDTGYFLDESIAYFANHHIHLDLISMDCTSGILKDSYDRHMCLDVVKKEVERLHALGAVDDKTKIILNHFSHNGAAGYDELVPIAERLGFIVSYDGVEIEV